MTQAERDEKKKQEKKEKKEDDGKEQEIDRSKMVKYSLGLKHNVWKQKGEEYRVAGTTHRHEDWGTVEGFCVMCTLDIILKFSFLCSLTVCGVTEHAHCYNVLALS